MKRIFACIFAALIISFVIFQYNYSASSLFISTNKIGIIDRQIIEKDQNDIEVSYPEFNGLPKGENAVVNVLIKDNIYEAVNQLRDSMHEGYNLFMDLSFKVEHLSDSFISISYAGDGGALNNAGRGYSNRLYTINIDVKHSRIVTKDDIFSNKLQIFELLMNNRFESITTIEGVKGGCPFSFFADDIGFINQDEGLDSPNIRYYIKEDNLVIVYSDSSAYYEYSIAIDKVEQYLNGNILKLIRKGTN